MVRKWLSWVGQAMLFPRSGAALAQACVAIWGSIGLETMVSIAPCSGAALAQACVAIWGSIGLETMVSIAPCSGAALAQVCVAIWGSIGLETMVSIAAWRAGWIVKPSFWHRWSEKSGVKNRLPGPARACGFTATTLFLVGLRNWKNQVSWTWLCGSGSGRKVMRKQAAGERRCENRTEAGSRAEVGPQTVLVRRALPARRSAPWEAMTRTTTTTTLIIKTGTMGCDWWRCVIRECDCRFLDALSQWSQGGQRFQ